MTTIHRTDHVDGRWHPTATTRPENGEAIELLLESPIVSGVYIPATVDLVPGTVDPIRGMFTYGGFPRPEPTHWRYSAPESGK